MGCQWVVYPDLASCPASLVSWMVWSRLCDWTKCEFLLQSTELFPISHLSEMGNLVHLILVQQETEPVQGLHAQPNPFFHLLQTQVALRPRAQEDCEESIFMFFLLAKPVSTHITGSELEVKWKLVKNLCKALTSESSVCLLSKL